MAIPQPEVEMSPESEGEDEFSPGCLTEEEELDVDEEPPVPPEDLSDDPREAFLFGYRLAECQAEDRLTAMSAELEDCKEVMAQYRRLILAHEETKARWLEAVGSS